MVRRDSSPKSRTSHLVSVNVFHSVVKSAATPGGGRTKRRGAQGPAGRPEPPILRPRGRYRHFGTAFVVRLLERSARAAWKS